VPRPTSARARDPARCIRRRTAEPGGGATEFGSAESRVYRWHERHPTARYLELLSTHSDHIVLGDARLRDLLDAVGEVLERHGGVLDLEYETSLWMATATGES